MNLTKEDVCLKIVDHSVIKSPKDKNDYYYDILPNGLRYIVVSNKDIDKSAVGLDVYIGSADDPKEYQGLAHCLEHIIFLGTKKYPNPSEFDNFLNHNSGCSNANTSLDHTNFHFEISNEELEKAVDMFSQFYYEPLFSKELLNKELNSIESEFKLEYRDDSNRLNHLILVEGYKDSQFNTFITGNLETLQKPEIRDKVIEFYNKYYDPKIMALCIFSNKTIEELKNMVIKYFTKIKNNPNFHKIPKKKLYDENNMGYYYKIVSVKDISYIKFIWIINKSYNSYYKSEPYTYVVSVLGHEGKHSLTAYLKNKEYIYNLVSSYDNTYDFFTEISIKLKLTDEGYSHLNEVIKIVLSYVDYLKKEGVHEDFFEEIKRTSEITFYLDEQYDPIELCEDISSSITITNLDEEMSVKTKITEYRPDLIKEILDFLTLKNLNIYLISSKLKNHENEKNNFNIENVYKTEYIKEKKDFSSFIFDIKSKKEIDLSYPELNPFLPSNLNMIDLSLGNINLNDYIIPKKVYDNERIIWYKPNIKYNMPKVYISSKVYMSNLNLDYTTALTYFDIFFKIINKELSEFLYLGELSDNSLNFSFTISSILIGIEGYSDSIEKYIDEYFIHLSKLRDIQKIEGINNKIISILKGIIQKLKNFEYGNVKDQTEQKLKIILREVYSRNRLEICQKFKDELEKNNIIPKGFLDFLKNIYKKLKYEWFIEGNIFLKDAERIIIKLENELTKWFKGDNDNKNNKEILSRNEIRKQRIIKIPEKKAFRYNFSSKDKENESSTIIIYFQIDNFYYNENNIFNKTIYDEYIKNKALLYMILSIYYEIFYDELRTEQQVGYDVELVTCNQDTVLGLYFYVSSSKYNPDEIVEKINNFIIDNDINDPENFTDEDYESYKKSVLNDLIKKPLTLEEEYNRDFSFISDRTYIFSLRQDLINYLNNNMTKQIVIDFFNEYIYKKAKRLEIALYSSKKNEEKKEEKMNIEEKDEEKEDDDDEDENQDDNNENKNKVDILPSYKDIEIEVIKDINDFHRNINYYDTEFY